MAVVVYRSIRLPSPSYIWHVWEGKGSKKRGLYIAPNPESATMWGWELESDYVVEIVVPPTLWHLEVWGAPRGNYTSEFIRLCRYKAGPLYKIYEWLHSMHGVYGYALYPQEIIIPPRYVEKFTSEAKITRIYSFKEFSEIHPTPEPPDLPERVAKWIASTFR